MSAKKILFLVSDFAEFLGTRVSLEMQERR